MVDAQRRGSYRKLSVIVRPLAAKRTMTNDESADLLDAQVALVPALVRFRGQLVDYLRPSL
jgi:hypothetical protein